jgi:hypothetical protein
MGDTGILTTDTTFVGYVIEGVAGRGGMGIVYRARESFPDRTVALKVISPQLAGDAEFRARFVRESNLAATIEHPNVLPIFRAGEEDGLLYLAMRYVEGTDLAALIADRGRVDPRHAVEIIVAICDALDAAHARGLVHRDEKPANVLIARQGAKEHVYLTDFGIAKSTDATGGPTMTGSFMGTLDYAAPEQIRSGHVDARTDVYATGCMLFHALAGQVPFPGDNPVARIYAHLSTAPPSLEHTSTSLPAGLDAVIAKAMAKDPNDRYLSAGDLGRAAKTALEGNSLTRAEHSVAVGDAAAEVVFQGATVSAINEHAPEPATLAGNETVSDEHVAVEPDVPTAARRRGRRKALLVIVPVLVALIATVLTVPAVTGRTSEKAKLVRAINAAPSHLEARGNYSMKIAPDWVALPNVMGPKFDLWQVAGAADDFAPNLNVGVESALGLDLNGYLELLTAKSAPKFLEGLTVRDRKIVRGPSGRKLGVVEYTATMHGRRLHYLAVTALGSGHFVTATLTAPEGRFAGIRSRVEPNMLSLRAR